jgi:hypothetical protein
MRRRRVLDERRISSVFESSSSPSDEAVEVIGRKDDIRSKSVSVVSEVVVVF